MAFRLLWIWVLALGAPASGETLYIDHRNTDPSATGSSASPFASITQALFSTPAASLTLAFLTQNDPQTYEFQTLGLHLEVRLACNNSALEVTAPILVGPGVMCEFEDCHFTSSLTSNAMVVDFGAVSILRGSVKGLQVKAFAVYSALEVTETEFMGNQDSLFAAQQFGLLLHVSRSTFQLNTSPAGVVLLLGLSATSSDSTTAVQVDNCVFAGNGAFQGGSFMYFSVNPNIEFSPTQAAQLRVVSVTNSLFDTNPGYLVISFTKFVDVVFAGNTYRNHDYGFLVKLLGGSFAVQESSVQRIARLLICMYVGGLLELKALRVFDVVEGSAIILRNDAAITAGFVHIEDVELRRVTILNTGLLSASLFAFNVAISVVGFRVFDGYSYACACGCYFFSAATVIRPEMGDMRTQQGAMVAFLYAHGEVRDLYLHNVKLERVAFNGAFYSTVNFHNMTMAPGEGSYGEDKGMTNILVAFDSTIKILEAYYDLPPLSNVVALYLWSTTAEAYNIMFPTLFSNVVDMYSASSLYLRNLTIGRGMSDCTIFISFHCNVTFEDTKIDNFVIRVAMFSGLSLSSITVKNLKVTNVTLPALAISSNSIMALSNIWLRNIQADTLFWYIVASHIVADNIVVLDSQYDLMQYLSGTLVLKDCVFSGVKVRRRFMTVINATITFDGVAIEGVEATTVNPFAAISVNSFVTFANTRMRYFRSREQGLVQLRESSLSLINSHLSDFNVTFAYATRSRITVLDSSVSTGGLSLMDADSKVKVSAGFVDAEDCRVTLVNSDFVGLSGTDGGAVSATSRRLQVDVTVESVRFEQCWAARDGGALRTVNSNLHIRASSFASNSADRGGCVYFECEQPAHCSATVSDSDFTNNTAREGGGVRWTMVRPTFTGISAENNSAVYGDFEASMATHMTLGNSNDSSMLGVPGVVVVEPILIAFLDAVNQTVRTDDKSTAKLESDHLIGTTFLTAKDGIANFSGVIVRTTPGTTVPISVFSSSINTTYPSTSSYSFAYRTRTCVPGEVSSDEGCYLCPKNTFSVNPLESECRKCPGYAICPGGYQLILSAGYWRPSEYHSDVYTCPIKSACDGGQNSTCGKGYQDRLCAGCVKGYYMAGLTYCVRCESLAIRAVRISIFLLVVSIIYAVVIRKSTSPEISPRTTAVLTTLKILFNFLQSVLMISLINVDWKSVMMGLFSSNEMFVSFAVTSLTIECFDRKRYTDGDMKPVFVRAIAASIIPLGLMACNWSVCLGIFLYKRSKKTLYSGFQSSLMLLYTVHPYLVKTGVALVTCKTIDSGTLWLTTDVSVRCWQAEHQKYVQCLFIPMFIVYIIGIPMSILASVSRLRKGGRRWLVTFFTAGYRPVASIWEFVIAFRKTLLILTLGLLGSVEPIIQIMAAMVILYLFLEWEIREGPFIRDFHNKLEGFSIFLQLVLTGFSFYFISELHIRDVILVIVSYAIMLLVVAFILISVGILVAQIVIYRKQVAAVYPALRGESFAQPSPSPAHAPPPSANMSALPLQQKQDASSGYQ